MACQILSDVTGGGKRHGTWVTMCQKQIRIRLGEIYVGFLSRAHVILL